MKAGANILAGISGPAKVYWNTLATADILQEDGVANVFAYLPSGFGGTVSMKFNNRISDWLDFARTNNMTMTAFICGYQPRIASLKAISLPSEIQGHLLLRQGKFGNSKKGLIIASAGGNFEIEKPIAALKGLYPEGSEIPAPSSSAKYHAPSTSCPSPVDTSSVIAVTAETLQRSSSGLFMRANRHWRYIQGQRSEGGGT